MSNLLPLETIEEILGYIDEDDIRTFYSLSLVNKTWCNLSIPHLWKKPFGIKDSNKNFYKMITIILSYLDEQQKSVLKINKKKVGIPTTKLSYNYPSYIRQLDFNKLFSLITEWITKKEKCRPKLTQDYFIKNSNKFTFDFSIFKEDEEDFEVNFSYSYVERCCLKDQEKLAFFEYIFKIIIERSRGIKELFIEIYCKDGEILYTIPKDFFVHLFRLPKVGKCFSGLREFTCKGNFYKASLINEIKKHSHGITRLEIYPREGGNDLKMKDLRELLKVQNNLRSFSFSSFSTRSESKNNALEFLQGTVVNTLESIQIRYGDITNDELKHLSKCKKMKNLNFDTIYFDEPIEVLEEIIYPDLEELVFINCNITSSSVMDKLKIFIKNNGNNLKHFHLIPSPTNNSDILSISDILSTLSDHCYNLENFHVNIDNQCDIILLFKILQQFKKTLKSLNIGGGDYYDKPIFNANEFMKEFTENFSITNILNLNISNWEISFDMLKYFIKNCGKNLKIFEGSCNMTTSTTTKNTTTKNTTTKNTTTKNTTSKNTATTTTTTKTTATTSKLTSATTPTSTSTSTSCTDEDLKNMIKSISDLNSKKLKNFNVIEEIEIENSDGSGSEIKHFKVVWD